MKKELIQKQSLIYHSEVMSEINSIADMNTSVNRGKYSSIFKEVKNRYIRSNGLMFEEYFAQKSSWASHDIQYFKSIQNG